MSDLFSQFVSLVTPKYAKVNTQETEIIHDNMMQKNHFRATLSDEDRKRFFPEFPETTPTVTSTEDSRTSLPTPTETVEEDRRGAALPTPPIDNGTKNMWDVALNDDEDEHVYETIDEVKRASSQQKVNDSLVLPAEKSRPQIADIFPNINEILIDHGIKEKLRDLTITVKNKLQKDPETAAPTTEPTEANDQPKESVKESIFSSITLPQPPSFITRTNTPQKLVPLQQSKDKTVQTYFPKETH